MKELALIGLVQTVYFSLIVFMKKRKELKDYFLILFLLLVGSELFYRYYSQINTSAENKWIAIFDIIYWAILGPVILLYVQSVINKTKKLELIHLLHLIPLIISIIPFIDYILISNHESFLYYYFSTQGFMKFAIAYVWEYTSFFYIVYSIVVLIKHRNNVKEFYSTTENKKLLWLLYLTGGFGFYIFISYLSWVLKDLAIIETSFKFIQIIVPVLVVYVFGVGLYGYKQEGVFTNIELKQTKIITSNKTKLRKRNTKYAKSGLGEIESEELKEKLRKVMKNEKPFLDCDLTISVLANKIETTTHKLSQVINETYHKNFFDFINSYRIEEVKNQLMDSENDHYKIMAVAYDCGFNSKSTFYSIFKKHTRLTPSEYKSEMLKQLKEKELIN